MIKSKKVLVTGSEGYIGSVLMEMLLEQGFEPHGLDVCFFSEGNINRTRLPSYPLIRKDIRDVSLEDLKGKNYGAIIHLAALSNDPLGKLDEHLTMDINFKASVHLARLAREANIERFVYSSSCSLYGQGGDLALTEESPSNPQTVYGKSKILSEQGLGELANDHFSPVYMRNATAFGISPRMRFDLVVNNLSGFAKVDGEIRIMGDGKPWRPLVHIRDIAGAMIAVLKAPKDIVHNQAFNVGDNDENYRVKQIAEKVKTFFPQCVITTAQKNAGDSRDYNVSFGKIKDVLGYDKEWSLDRGLGEIRKEYDGFHLNKEIFEDRLYTRLKQIQYLMSQKIVDQDLRRVS